MLTVLLRGHFGLVLLANSYFHIDARPDNYNPWHDHALFTFEMYYILTKLSRSRIPGNVICSYDFVIFGMNTQLHVIWSEGSIVNQNVQFYKSIIDVLHSQAYT